MPVSTGEMLLDGLSWTFGAIYLDYGTASLEIRGWAANLAGFPVFIPGFSIESLCEAIRATKEDIYG